MVPSQPTASTPAPSLFSPTTPASSTQTPGYSFGSQATPTPGPATAGLSLGLSAAELTLGSSSTPLSSGITGDFGLGNRTLSSAVASNAPSQISTPPGSVFGPPTTTATQPASSVGFSFHGGNASQTGTTGFNLGSMGNASQPSVLPGLTFAAAPPVSTAAASTQPQTAFGSGGLGLLSSSGSAAVLSGSLASSFSQGPASAFGSTPLGSTPAPAAAAPGPALFASTADSSFAQGSAPSLSSGAPSTSVGVPGFGLKLPGSTSAATSTTASASTPGLALSLKPLTTLGTGIIPSTSAALPAATPAPRPTMDQETSSVMTYAQLESLINKWSLELEDQEKHFLHQATQVNAWDQTLIENGEKITSLHREVEKVKLDQKRLDQELDFILSQQKELEDLLTPLEEAVKEQSGTIYLQHADEEREKTYQLAETIDAQLKRMAQDLKDVIEHLNVSGGSPDTSDPLQQVCKILNAHMDSLQWIDQNSASLQRKVEEVSKVCESRRKEQERSYRMVFD
ncbi:nuclear pore glycoprotein p62-like [Gracilinanus agilis]|uniref:nuclear pore glycoprotein p62-like n=1 Tax=Gracilinanus agilis TaxID=191870 RepID=UPI001CFF29D5|nr:nuclear pore glycoprotein p62-like [Gracilinanus agilis]XP_044537167.1 nuclear pore glycoprotein p62-like [Gracilinanus agilis]